MARIMGRKVFVVQYLSVWTLIMDGGMDLLKLMMRPGHEE
jgi:hypothetical protein